MRRTTERTGCRPDGVRIPGGVALAESTEQRVSQCRSGATRSARGRLLICVLLGIATFAVYAQALGFEFVAFDDDRYVTKNEVVQRGLSRDGLLWAFTAAGPAQHTYWQPLTWLSLMLDREVYGSNPAGFHATNILLHLLNALLLFALLQAMTGRLWRSGFVAALFAVHPLHVESVAWIAERKNVLSTSFGLLSTYAYIGFARRGGVPRYLAAAAFLALGLMAKAMLVTLPLVFLLLDYWPLDRTHLGGRPREQSGRLRRSAGSLLLEKLPLLAISAASGLVTFLVQRAGAAVLFTGDVPLHLRIANAAVSYVSYLRRMIWPTELSAFYPHPYIPWTGGTPWSGWEVAGSVLILLAITVLALRATHHRYLIVGWLWYLGTLVPVIGLVHFGAFGMADRFTYLPSIGLFLIVAWGGADLGGGLARSRAWVAPATAVLAVAMLVAMAAAARSHTRVWRDSHALFEHALRATPRNSRMHFNLGNMLKARGDFDGAMTHYGQALEIHPGYAKAHVNLGNIFYARGQLDQAIRHYREALASKSDLASAHLALGMALRRLERRGDAIAHLRRAVELEPGSETARRELSAAIRDGP